VDAAALVKEIGRDGVQYAASVPEGVARLVKDARDGDVIVTLGAGSVSHAGGLLLEGLAG
jgi:UDP-N-acetylmuramate--alanine ligase